MAASDKVATTLTHVTKYLSKRLIAAYIIDWIIILHVTDCLECVETLTLNRATAAVGGGFAKIEGNKHAFSLSDPAISYPYKPNDTVTFGELMVVALVGPGVITFLVSLLFVPGSTVGRRTSKALLWRRKFWEWNTAWMGLGVALAFSFMVTEGLKNLAGKPRPDLLARCNPDTSASALHKYQVGGLYGPVYGESTMVDWHICRNQDRSVLNDGFTSWPSGHSSFSWAGMLYLTLWLCSKFAITIPYLSPAPYAQHNASAWDKIDSQSRSSSQDTQKSDVPARNQAAAPPVHLLVVAVVPIAVALFVCVSRYSDYRHAGFDIISGAVIGAVFALLGFRWYHMPIQRGAGWAWGARTRDRAFFVGVGIPTYVGSEGWESAKAGGFRHDIESQDTPITGHGTTDRGDTDRIDAERSSGH